VQYSFFEESGTTPEGGSRRDPEWPIAPVMLGSLAAMRSIKACERGMSACAYHRMDNRKTVLESRVLEAAGCVSMILP